MLTNNNSNLPLPASKSKVLQSLVYLAKKRQDNTPTSDLHAAFKEGERAPVARASE